MRLVWIESARGPVAQKWPEDRPHINADKSTVVLHSYLIKPDEDLLTIAELARRYPGPATGVCKP